MFANNSISNNTNGSLEPPIQQPPSCIVVGCKNGSAQSSQPVKYYQVPQVHHHQPQQQQHTNQTARQWYINTLREDLLELIDSTPSPPLHYVCIEHFDEESFVLANANEQLQPDANEQMIMVLKEDAVPSLFEIEVFQKVKFDLKLEL